MKRVFLLLLLLPLLFSCAAKESAPTAELTMEAVSNNDFLNDFTRADADFLKTNFGEHDYIDDGVVYLSDHGEIGFFRVKEEADTEKMLSLIKSYAESEREAMRSLASLYPTAELETRLSRFEHLKSGKSGKIVYYLLLDNEALLAARNALGL